MATARMPVVLVLIASAAAALLAGCSSGTGSAPGNGQIPAVAVPVASVGDFCANLDALNSTAQQVGLDSRLPAVRSDMQQSAAKAQQVLSSGVPKGSAVGPRLVRLVSDLRDIALWLDTDAKQSDLDADRVPSRVRESVDDMGYEFRQLQKWTIANCNNQRRGDGQ